MTTPSEELTRQFYSWELRGRGWQVWPYPVELEPPFRPFFGHYVPQIPARDDGRRPTFLSSLADGIRGLVADKPASPDLPIPFADDLIEEEAPEAFFDDDRLWEIRINLPPDF